jgi:phosphoglycolate phosphatase-like HAD superfamily hydrolase
MAPRSVAQSSPYTKIKGVIWDVDGTLADSWKLGYDATVVVLKNNGVPHISEEEYHQGTVYCTPERLARHAGLEPSDEDFDVVGERLGAEFDNMYVDLVGMDTAGFYPGISNLLNSLSQDVRLGALTNACVAYAHAVLKTNCPVMANGEMEDEPIYSRFGSIRGADNVPTPKPSPDGLFEVCKDLGLQPDECIYVGDSPSDGAAAKAAGMGAIGVLWGSHPEENLRKAPFDHLCSTVEELQALMPR